MPRKILVCLVLGAVVLALAVLVPWPGDPRPERHNMARVIVWIALLAALPWPGARLLAQLLGLIAIALSFGDTLDAADQIERAARSSASSTWPVVRLLRGLLGLVTSVLVLWSHTRTDVIMWCSRDPSLRGDEE